MRQLAAAFKNGSFAECSKSYQEGASKACAQALLARTPKASPSNSKFNNIRQFHAF
jgi:hypothetical protein